MNPRARSASGRRSGRVGGAQQIDGVAQLEAGFSRVGRRVVQHAEQPVRVAFGLDVAALDRLGQRRVEIDARLRRSCASRSARRAPEQLQLRRSALRVSARRATAPARAWRAAPRARMAAGVVGALGGRGEQLDGVARMIVAGTPSTGAELGDELGRRGGVVRPVVECGRRSSRQCLRRRPRGGGRGTPW